MNDTKPYVQRPNDFHQCFEYVDHDTRCTHTAIVGEYFCVHHRIQPSPIILHPEDGFYLPPLTDRDSIVRVASDIAERLAYKAIDDKRAGKILYACQIANQALEGKLRDQKLALQQAATNAANAQNPTPTPPTTLQEPHPDPAANDLTPATDSDLAPQPQPAAILTLEAAAIRSTAKPRQPSHHRPRRSRNPHLRCRKHKRRSRLPSRCSHLAAAAHAVQSAQYLLTTMKWGADLRLPISISTCATFSDPLTLEIELQRQLANTRIAAKRGDLAELRQVVELQTSRCAELSSVERIEELKPKLQLGLIGGCKLLEQRGIKVRV